MSTEDYIIIGGVLAASMLVIAIGVLALEVVELSEVGRECDEDHDAD